MPAACAVEVRRRADERAPGCTPSRTAVLRSVHVGEERLERADALLDARLDVLPLVDAAMTRGTASSGNGRSSPAKSNVTPCARYELAQRIGATAQLLLRHPRERRVDLAVRLAHLAGLGGEHLVPRASGALRSRPDRVVAYPSKSVPMA